MDMYYLLAISLVIVFMFKELIKNKNIKLGIIFTIAIIDLVIIPESKYTIGPFKLKYLTLFVCQMSAIAFRTVIEKREKRKSHKKNQENS